MIPVECVVRNLAAGSLVRRLGVQEGLELNPPTFELFLKNDALHDPMVNESHVATFGWATADQMAEMKRLTFAVNDVLKPLFANAGMLLVDYKLEFGVFNGEVVCWVMNLAQTAAVLWDKETRTKLDKESLPPRFGWRR